MFITLKRKELGEPIALNVAHIASAVPTYVVGNRQDGTTITLDVRDGGTPIRIDVAEQFADVIAELARLGGVS